MTISLEEQMKNSQLSFFHSLSSLLFFLHLKNERLGKGLLMKVDLDQEHESRGRGRFVTLTTH